MKIYRCLKCDNIVINYFIDKNLKCCDEDMVELIPNSAEGESDIHNPLIRRIGNLVTVTVGEKLHPMVDVHHLDFVILETDKSIYYRKLELEKVPVVDFLVLNEETVIRAYAYCNNHELWSSEFTTEEKENKNE